MDEFHFRLEKKLNAEIERMKEDLTRNIDEQTTWGTRGAIQALKGALNLCAEVDKEINS